MGGAGTTRRRTRGLKTADPREAERARARLEVESNEGRGPAARLPWAEFVERYSAEELARLKSYTPKKARSALDRFAAGERPAWVADVDAAMISRHATALLKAGLKPVTVRTHLAHLRAALRWAHRIGLLRSVPHVEGVEVPKERNLRHLPAGRFPELLAAMPSPGWRLFALTAWHTGMRLGELFLLRWSQGAGPWSSPGMADTQIKGVNYPWEVRKWQSDARRIRPSSRSRR